jgi:hypothetical protein
MSQTEVIEITAEGLKNLDKAVQAIQKKGKIVVDPSVSESKAFKKYVKLTSEDMGNELLKKTPEELKKILAECDIYEFEVKAELEADENYQKVKLQKKDLESATKDVIAPVKAKRAVALDLLALYEDNK